MTWVIRGRRDSDLRECAALLARVHVAQRYPIHWPDDPSAWLAPADVAAAWVAVQDDSVIGHVCLVRTHPRAHELMLERLFVSPVVAGSGVGTALVCSASAWAAEHRARLSLDVVDNCASAVALYDRLGWRLTGTTPIDWGDGVAQCLLHFVAPSG